MPACASVLPTPPLLPFTTLTTPAAFRRMPRRCHPVRTRPHLGGDGRVAAEGVLHGVCHIHILPQQVAVHLWRHGVVHLRMGRA